MKILIATEDKHHVYRDAIGGAFKELRPDLEVIVTGIEYLEYGIENLDPLVVISSRPVSAVVSTPLAWVELSLEPSIPSWVCVDGQESEVLNPGIRDLLAVVHEAQRLSELDLVA